MSANGEKSAVMKGITHGACDYLLKPVRIEELRNIWQHVIRKKRQETKELGHSKSLDEGGDRQRRGGVDDNDYTSSATDTDGNWKCTKKRKESKEEEEDNEQENDDPSTMKKPRVVWSVELHQQFVSAVNQLGIDSKIVFSLTNCIVVVGMFLGLLVHVFISWIIVCKCYVFVSWSMHNNLGHPFVSVRSIMFCLI